MRNAIICLLLCLNGVAVNFCLAASFDCKSAKTEIEKQICENKELNQLDENLAAKYKDKIKVNFGRIELINQQREWIGRIRNKCPDTTCLITAYQKRLKQIETNVVPLISKNCPVLENDVTGNWKRISKGDFEEFSLSRENGEYNFTSWAHGRPEMVGIWRFKDCSIYIADKENEKIAFNYRVLKFKGQEICLEELSEKEKSCYKKIP